MNAEAIDLLIRTELPAAARGHRDAYGRILVACQHAVTAVALASTRAIPASDDLAQAAFLPAWQDLTPLQNPPRHLPCPPHIPPTPTPDHLLSTPPTPPTH